MPPRKKTKVADNRGDRAKSRGSKRVNTTVRPVRGRRGGLKDMPTMPLDVLLEIFKYMHPRDLLYLARTTKEFRAFLMNRTSAPYWRETLKNVPDVPPCPPFLCEPAYINLLFTTNCMRCGKSHSGTQWVIWDFFVRYCQQCQPGRIYHWCQAANLTKAKYKSYFENDEDEADHRVCNCVLDLTMVDARIAKYKDQESWLVDELEKTLEEWFVVKNTDKAEEFLKQLRIRRAEVAKAAELCKDWYERELATKEDMKRAQGRSRLTAILARLREEGWGDEIDYLRSSGRDFAQLEIVRRKTELTEDGWAKVWSVLEPQFRAARDRLEELTINPKMDTRFANLRLAIQEFNRTAAARALDARPGFYDYIAMPEIAKLAGAPLRRKVDFGDFLPLLPTLAAAWLAECKSALRGIVRRQLPSIDASVDPLGLFAALFCCTAHTNCRHQPQYYPAVLEHHCLRYRQITAVPQTMLAKHLKRNGPHEPLLVTLAGIAAVSPQALDVLAVLGKDPACTTAADLEGNYTILECARCSPKEGCVFTWKSAIAHSHSEGKVEWLPLLNDKGVNVKVQREAEARAAAEAKAADARAGTEANAEAGTAAAGTAAA